MSSEIAIKVESLSKCYQIYGKPHDRLKQTIYPRLQRLVGQPGTQYFREFWALRDVTFEVKKGETVGIIGRNGSGKSTLLQMICGTLNPTSGSIQTHGRVAALLELGSGFNPEFTGRENVYLNASVLGLSRAETDARFANIEAFADIGDFIEQPVKTYSSGMMVRLAFAVIAHVDADILVVDEALAVGDAIFTQKCMRYIRNFQERGTLLFVSHDIGSVLNLCKTGVWLNQGMVQSIGASKKVAEAYLQYTQQQVYGEGTKIRPVQAEDVKQETLEDNASKDEYVPPQLNYEAKLAVQDNMAYATGWQSGIADLVSVQLNRLDNASDGPLLGGEKVRVVVRARTHQTLDRPILGFLVRDRLGQDLFGENTLSFTNLHRTPAATGQEIIGEFIFRLPMLPNGQYAIMASVADGDLHDHVQHHFLHNALIVNVTSSKVRWGLVGVEFEQVILRVANDE